MGELAICLGEEVADELLRFGQRQTLSKPVHEPSLVLQIMLRPSGSAKGAADAACRRSFGVKGG